MNLHVLELGHSHGVIKEKRIPAGHKAFQFGASFGVDYVGGDYALEEETDLFGRAILIPVVSVSPVGSKPASGGRFKTSHCFVDLDGIGFCLQGLFGDGRRSRLPAEGSCSP